MKPFSKKIVSLMLSLGMVLSLSASAFAAENETAANIVPIESIEEL